MRVGVIGSGLTGLAAACTLALAARSAGAVLISLAIEYTFWDERLPETLLRFGKPVRVAGDMSTEAATERLESALVATMEELKTAAMARDASAFRVLLRGGRSTGRLFAMQPLALDPSERREPPRLQD